MHLKTEDGFVSGDCWSLISWTLKATRRLCPLAQTRRGNVEEKMSHSVLRWTRPPAQSAVMRRSQRTPRNYDDRPPPVATRTTPRCGSWPGGRRATLRAEERVCITRITSDLLISDFQPLECNRQVIRISITSPPPPWSLAAASPRWLVSLTQSQRAVLIWSPRRWSMAVIDGDYDKHPLKHI